MMLRRLSGVLLLLWLMPGLLKGQQQSSHNCVGEIVTLTCPTDRTIDVIDADYGVYNRSDCRSSCCVPEDFDCLVFVDDADPPDDRLEEIKSQCQNLTTCELEFFTSVGLPDCPSPQASDFLVIHYNCLGDDVPDTTQEISTPPSTTTTTTTRKPANPPEGGDDPNVGAIVGGILGGLFITAVILFVAWYLYRNKDRLRPPKNARMVPPPQPHQNGHIPMSTIPVAASKDKQHLAGHGAMSHKPAQAYSNDLYVQEDELPPKTTKGLDRKTSAVREYDVPFKNPVPVYENIKAARAAKSAKDASKVSESSDGSNKTDTSKDETRQADKQVTANGPKSKNYEEVTVKKDDLKTDEKAHDTKSTEIEPQEKIEPKPRKKRAPKAPNKSSTSDA